MMPAYYIGSTGLGENLQAVPAMRALAQLHKTRVTPVIRIPHHAVFQFDDEELAPAIGWPLHYGDGEVVMDKALLGYLKSRDQFFRLASHMRINCDISPASRNTIISMRPSSDRLDVVRSIYTRFGGPPMVPAETFKLSCYFKGLEDIRPVRNHAVICAGSGEALRQLPLASMELIAGACKERGFRHITLLLAANQVVSHPIPFPFVPDLRTEKSLLSSARVIANAGVVITPDSGLFNLALALGKKCVWLESREPAIDLISPICMEQIVQFRKESPACNLGCRARNEDGYNQPNYPLGLACWEKSPAPCLTYDASDAHRISELAVQVATNPA